MSSAIGPSDAERFRELIRRRLGFGHDDGKLAMLSELLRRRLDATRSLAEAYLSRLEVEAAPEELRALARELTVGETYFFRNSDQFRALREVALPDRLRAQGTARTLRLLSAGCSSGEEPYTLAMVLREALPDPTWKVSIRAFDVNPAALEKAARGTYSSWALRETPEAARQRWFRTSGSEAVLDPEIRGAVTFEEHNFMAGDAELWAPGSYDVIFCRNVLMYFTPDNARAVMERIARALAPGGYLFLGHAETLRGLSQEFHLRHTHETFYYQRKLPGEEAPTGASAWDEPVARAVTAPALAAIIDTSDSWVETIRRAAERIQTLSTAAAPAAPHAPMPPPRPRWDLGEVFELLRVERFAEALERVQTLPSESASDPDVQLLHAALLTHTGALARAEDACRRLLQRDELNAGAHYLLALCRQGTGDARGAVEEDQIAIYLDPRFAMPHLHLGLQARRAGDRARARRSLTQAAALLETEDASRLLLFGGGFTRETLLALCRAELQAVGGAP